MNAAEQKSFRFLTWNVKMLPGYAGEGSGDEKRAANMVQKILRQDYDIICLQELFDEDAREIFSKGLKTDFPFQVKKADDGSIFQQDSGLFVASRFPFFRGKTAHRFKEFDDCAGMDCFAEKGILAVHFDLKNVKNGLNLVIFNTHLQSDYEWTGENSKTRLKQLRQVRRFMQRTIGRLTPAERKKTTALFAGDLNIDGSSREWQRIFNILEYPRDLYEKSNNLEQNPGYTWDYRENSNMIPQTDKDRLRLDYIFALDNVPVKDDDQDMRLAGLIPAACSIQHFATTKKQRLSDHFAVEAKLILPLEQD